MANDDREVVIKISARNLTQPEFEAVRQQVGALSADVQASVTKFDAVAAGMSRAGAAASDSGRMIAGMGDAGRAALEQLNPHVSTLRQYLENLKPSTENAHDAFTSLKGTLTEMWEHPTVAVGDLAKAVGTDLVGGLSGAAVGLGAVVAVGAVGVGVMFELAEKAAGAGSQIYDFSLKTGMSTTAVSSLKSAVEIAGGSIDTVSNAIFMLQKRMGEDTPEFEKGLKRVGLNLDEIRNLTPDQMFMKIGEALRDMADPVERNAAGAELFGRQFRELVPTIMKDLPGMVDEFKDLGVAWSEEDAKGADEFEVASRKLHAELGLISTVIGRELIPAFTTTMQFADWSVGWVLRWANNNPSMEGWRQIRAIIATLNQDIGQLPAVTGPAVAGVTDLFTGTLHLASANADWDAANANLSAQLDDLRSQRMLPLTDQQKAMIVELHNAKADTGDLARVIAGDFNVSLRAAKEAIAAYEEAHKQAEEAAKKHRAEIEKNEQAVRNLTTAEGGYDGVMQALGGDVVYAIRYELEHKASIEDIARVYGVEKEAIKVVGDELKTEVQIAKTAAEEHKALLKELATVEQAKNADSTTAIQKIGLEQEKASQKHFEGDSKMLTDLGKLNDQYNTELAKGAETTADAQIAQVKKWADDEKLKYADAEEFVRVQYYDKVDQIAQLRMQHIYEAHSETFKDIKTLLNDLDAGPGGWTDTFAHTLTTTHSFTDAALGAFKQLQKDLENVGADMLSTLIKAFLQPFLDRLKATVAQGAASLANMVAGVGPGGAGGGQSAVGGAVQVGGGLLGGYMRGSGGTPSDGYGVYAPGQGPIAGSGNANYGTGAMEGAGGGFGGAMAGGAGAGAVAGISAAAGGGSTGSQLGQVGLAAGIGVGAGIATGAAIGATVAIGAATFGIGAAVIGVIALYQHLKKVSDEEKAARQAYQDWQSAADTTFTAIASQQEKTEAGGDKLKQTQVLARDAYMALGVDGSKAITDIGTALDATHTSADDVKKSTDNMTAAIKLYAQELPLAVQGEQAATAQLSTMKALTPDLEAALKKVYDSKNVVEYADNVTALNALLGQQKTATSAVDATLQKYGLDWTELGAQAREAKLSELAQGLTTDFNTLRDAGVDVNAEMRGMAPKVNEFIASAQKAGVEVPSAMQTVIQTAIDAGVVYDDNKNKITDITQLHIKFGDTAKTELSGVTDAITHLADVLKLGLGGAFVSASATATVATGNMVNAIGSVARVTHDQTQNMQTDWNAVHDSIDAATYGNSPDGIVGGYIPALKVAQDATDTAAKKMAASWATVKTNVDTATGGVDDWALAMANAKTIMSDPAWQKGEGSKLAALAGPAAGGPASEAANVAAVWQSKYDDAQARLAGTSGLAHDDLLRVVDTILAGAAAAGVTVRTADNLAAANLAAAGKTTADNLAKAAATSTHYIGGVMNWSNDDVLWAARNQNAKDAQTGMAEWNAAVSEAKRRGLAMAEGGMGRVTRPTVFLAGEAGPEDYAFSGGGRGFSDPSNREIVNELRALRDDLRRAGGPTVYLSVDAMTGTAKEMTSAEFRRLSRGIQRFAPGGSQTTTGRPL